MGVVKSKAFQMNTKTLDTAVPVTKVQESDTKKGAN
jgi:hypothetical protein